MKVLFPVHQQRGEGIATFVRGLATALRHAAEESDRIQFLTVDSPKVLRLAGRAERVVQEQLVLPIRARGIDLVHLPDHRPLLTTKRPFLLTIHDVFFLDHPEWYSASVARYKRAMLQLAIQRRPSGIAFVSDFAQRTFFHHFPEATNVPRRVIHPGVAAPVNRDGERGSYFLTVGRLEPRKNHLMLLEAFCIARERGLDLRWVVVGKAGHAATSVERQLRSTPGVNYRGSVDGATLERLYAEAQFVAAPSIAEGFGFPPLEAMRARTPALVATGSAFDEVVGDAAIQRAPDDPQGWAEALKELAEDEQLRARLVRQGSDRVARFTWRAAARGYLKLYDEVCATHA